MADFFFDILTIVLSFIWGIKYLTKITISTRYIVYAFFYLFYVFPLLLDYFVSFPSYDFNHNLVGFEKSYNDQNTRVLYDFSLIVVQSIILFYKRKESKLSHFSNRTIKGRTIKKIVFLGMI